MLHGKGGAWDDTSQVFLTKKCLKKRQKGLLDSTKLTDTEKAIYEISGADGTGMTNSDTYIVKQFPYPTDATIRKKKDIDIRKVDPRIGD